MARRRRKVNQEQKDKLLKPNKPEKQPDQKKADGPFTANLKLDNKDAMTITEMQHTVGNKAVQRLVIQRFFGQTEEDPFNSKVASSPSVMGGGEQGVGMPGSVFPTNQGAEQLPIEMKGGSPATEQQAGQNLPESKAGSQDSLEFKVESGNSQQISEEAPGADISQGVDKVEQLEAHERPTLYFGSQGPAVVALQRAGVAFNIGLCVQQLAASQELELEEQRDVLFKDAISRYMEAANTPGKADRLVDIQTNSLDRIRECRAKEPPAGEPYGLEQLDQPETAVEEELEEHEAQ